MASTTPIIITGYDSTTTLFLQTLSHNSDYTVTILLVIVVISFIDLFRRIFMPKAR